MTLDTALKSFRPAQTLSFPNLDYLVKAKNRILDRWPDIVPTTDARDAEVIIASFLAILEKDDWKDVKLVFVLRAVRVAFSENFRTRPDIKPILAFVYAELEASTNRSFVNALASIYVSTYTPRDKHSVELGERLKTKRDLLNGQWQSLEIRYAQFFDGRTAHELIGMSMLEMEDPWAELKKIGIRDPHAAGLMGYAQDVYIEKLAPRLKSLGGVHQLFKWLSPEKGRKHTVGSANVIRAVLHPWLDSSPSEEFRKTLLHYLLNQYGNPRTNSIHWLGVGDLYRKVLARWDAGANLRSFIEVVDKTQDHPQWLRRRNLWLTLYEEGLIEEAWAAFCQSAKIYARNYLQNSEDGDERSLRFGSQTKRGKRITTSIILMKIGDKIVVDGCHDYSTHIFSFEDRLAPRLFEPLYDCDEDVTYLSYCHKSHQHIERWAEWVRQTINGRLAIPDDRRQKAR